MTITRHILLILFTFLFSIGIWSQSDRYTNVDTNYLTPKWLLEPLSVTNYRNGKSLEICKEIHKFYYLNKPACIIKNINGQDIYFYNQTSIIPSNGDTLAPKGYRIANINDYKTLLNSPKNFLHNTNMTGYIDLSYYDLGDLKYIWTCDELGREKGVALKITPDEISFDEIPFDYGCQVYCVENLDETIQDSSYSYKKLIPIGYNEILNRLKSSIIDNHELKNNDEISLKAQISILRDGTNQSKVLGDLTKNAEILKNQDALILSLNTVLENSLIPYYHGQIVQSKSEFNFSVKYNESISTFNEFYIYRIKNVNNILKKDLERADKFGFSCSNKEKIYSLFENGTFISSQKMQTINEFKGKGPIYSVYSFIPGLGIRSITKNNFNSNSRINFKNFLLSSSISLGAISIGSKIASNIFYNRYKNDIHGDAADYNYKNANALQKVFLTTGVGYCLLGAIDFTWTFSIGCKNKATQLRLNNQIKANPSNFILK